MKHHTKNKGDLGVLKAKCDLVEKGYLILSPETEHAPFDLVAYKDGNFKRVQVKYRTVEDNGAVKVQFKTSWADKHGSHVNYYDLDSIDLFCIYCPDTNTCYYIKSSKDLGKSIHLRVDEPKSHRQKNMHFAEDFMEIPE